jgi:pyroglutamyl-peptidase
MPLKTSPNIRAKNSRQPTQTILLTGFEPFGDDPGALCLNPSAAIAAALHGQRIGDWRIAGHVLPCEYGRSARVLKTLMREYQPQAMICLGQAGGRNAISIERIAINWDEAALADNAGILRTGQPIFKTAPAAYFSTLPIHAMQDALLSKSIPAEISSSAGQFVCNHVFFSLMHALRREKSSNKTRAGFIHVPYLPEQAAAVDTGMPAMPFLQMQAGIAIAISCL